METNIQQLVCVKCWKLFFSTKEFQSLCQQKTSTHHNGPRINERDVIVVGHVRKKDGIPSYSVEVEDILSGALLGCNWCNLLKPLSVHFESKGKWPEMNIAAAPKSSQVHIELRQAFNTQCVPDGNNCFELEVNWNRFELCAFTSDASGREGSTVTARPVRTRVDDRVAVDQIKTWIRQCTSHKACSAPAPTKLPTRLIDITPCDSLLDARLHITQKATGEYVALSYCWGPSQRGVTTKSNIEDRTRNLDVSSLSKTAQDAIHTTKLLGYRYLWIDALCIIQDSEEDKVRELSSMSDIYHNSSLTIVAANASSSEQGFLHPRQPPHAFQIPFWATDEKLSSAYMHHWDRGTSGEEHEIINKRAWTLQERLLSRKRLTYNSDALHYTCTDRTATNGDSILVLTSSSFFTRYRLPFNMNADATGEAQLSIRQILKAWTSIVNFYTQRDLSKQEDRLTAVAAIAARFSDQLNEIYLAGLWAGPYLFSSLLWYPLDDKIDCEWSTTMYVAPSWSWAGRRKAVEYDCQTWDHTFSPFHFEVKRANLELCSASLPFGAIKRASLHVRGLIRQGIFIAPNAIRWSEKDTSGPDTASVILPAMASQHGEQISEAWAWWDDTVSVGYYMRIWCLAVRTPSIWAAKGDREDEEKDVLDGLIVAEADEPGAFRRMGLFLDGKIEEFANCELSDLILV